MSKVLVRDIYFHLISILWGERLSVAEACTVFQVTSDELLEALEKIDHWCLLRGAMPPTPIINRHGCSSMVSTDCILSMLLGKWKVYIPLMDFVPEAPARDEDGVLRLNVHTKRHKNGRTVVVRSGATPTPGTGGIFVPDLEKAREFYHGLGDI